MKPNNKFFFLNILIFFIIISNLFCGGGGGGSDNNSTPDTVDGWTTVTGVVTPISDESSSDYTIVCLGETSSVDSAGTFSIPVRTDYVNIVAAMYQTGNYGLMNIVVSQDKILKAGSSLKASSSSQIELSAHTTAVSLVFISSYFLTNEPVRALALLDIIDNDPAVDTLAVAIGNHFNEADPLENSDIQFCIGEAIRSVLDTILLSSSKSASYLNLSKPYSPKYIRLQKVSKDSSNINKLITKLMPLSYSIDLDYININISQNSDYIVDVESKEGGAVDWIGEVSELDSSQFQSLNDLLDKASNNFNIYNRTAVIGKDRASAKSWLRWIDIIGTLIDTAFDYFTQGGVKISSQSDSIYLVRSYSGGGWYVDQDEKSFILSIPNGKQNDTYSIILNIVSLALDGISVAVDINDLANTNDEEGDNIPCQNEIIESAIDSLIISGVTFSNEIDYNNISTNFVKDVMIGISACTSKEMTKYFLAFLGKAILKTSMEAAELMSGYKWCEIAGTAGKMVDRVYQLFYCASPLESAFIVVGSPFEDIEAPSIPASLFVTASSSSRINLFWDASSDNVGVAGYKVYRDGSFLKTVSSTTTSDTGLSSNTEYCYSVSAYDKANNESGKCTQICATTYNSGGQSSVTVTGIVTTSTGNPLPSNTKMALFAQSNFENLLNEYSTIPDAIYPISENSYSVVFHLYTDIDPCGNFLCGSYFFQAWSDSNENGICDYLDDKMSVIPIINIWYLNSKWYIGGVEYPDGSIVQIDMVLYGIF